MKRIFYFLSILLFISCNSSKNSPEFIETATGRYLFNSNEALEVYFTEGILKVKWRDQDMTPIKANDSSFYLKEMNEKLVFISTPSTHIELAPKREHEGKRFYFSKLKQGEKTPAEYFKNKEYKKALDGYLAIKQKDSLDRSIQRHILTRMGRDYLNQNKGKEAIEILKINVALYPKSPSAHWSLGYIYMELKDTLKAVENYKKTLKLNPDDSRALRFFERHHLNRN